MKSRMKGKGGRLSDSAVENPLTARRIPKSRLSTLRIIQFVMLVLLASKQCPL